MGSLGEGECEHILFPSKKEDFLGKLFVEAFDTGPVVEVDLDRQVRGRR